MNHSSQSGLAARALLAAALVWSCLFWTGSIGAQLSTADAAGEAVEYPPVYRVEAIVFRHADARSDRRRAPGPADFTERLDPLLVAYANEAAQQQLARLARFLPVAEVPGTQDETTPFLEFEEQRLRPVPPVYAALGDLSSSMQRAMSRLLDAPDYEPVATRGWIQFAPPQRRSVAVRVHDRTVVEKLESAVSLDPVPSPHVLPFGPLFETPPPARAIYRLDGSVNLRQRRFLHLDLDLVWQSRTRAPADPGVDRDFALKPGTGAERDREAKADAEKTDEGDWALHRLQQSRVVRPGRLEYFDSSLFGVLVRIERFELVVPEIEDAPTQPTVEAPDAPGGSAPARQPVTETGG